LQWAVLWRFVFLSEGTTMSPQPKSVATESHAPNKKRIPTKKPTFTKADLVAKIPKHCFERSTFRSTLYLLRDLAGIAVLYYLSTWISVFPWFVGVVLWPSYWVLQGGFATGLWVVAHECGHRAYSESILVCDIVGLVLHSILLVPYHSWRISHGKHHRSTGDITRDEAFVPARLSKIRANNMEENKSIVRATVEMVLMFLVGWYVYLSFHVTGRDYGKHTDHYNPKSPLFSVRDYWSVVISDIAILIVLATLAYWIYASSFSEVFFVFGVPLGIVNFWLLLYTLLHHTDPEIPHYSHEAWDWLLGALTTVDRDYGVWDWFHHDIGSTHVLHHLFSKIPHYHAREASEAIKPLLGDYYNESKESILGSLWKVTKYCQYVDDVNAVDGVLWFPTPKQ